jgi:response regulator RpfG family c-di-GMP phosphodiesterase
VLGWYNHFQNTRMLMVSSSKLSTASARSWKTPSSEFARGHHEKMDGIGYPSVCCTMT